MRHLDQIIWLLRHPGFRAQPLLTCSRVLAWQYQKYMKDSVTLQLDDITIHARTSDGIARLVSYFGSKADEMFIFMQLFLKPGDRFIDIGANIGTHSIMGAQLVGPGGMVESIEADPDTYRFLNGNIQRNNISNITVHNRCVSNVSGISMFNINKNSARNSLSVKGEKTIELQLIRVDEICDAGEIALLKIDVEGADYLVLQGADGLFQNDPPKAVIIERSEDTLKIESYLESHDYCLMDFDSQSNKLVPMHDKTENIYAIHRTALDRIRRMVQVTH
ncbi:FkbM family methyltransferase [Methylobacterium brachythecii]|uniref:FkbM family methyltransferase n=2 Tax=Methylobacterium brachythecii TaxID=1176177 RepID=A0A7W6F795_9HYPH|nr:FkbM family methyltransferase [Methylobacterium brachythecii]MBB3903155.1 FkbM family methyltransferase [Methylobacterium brachythecii]